MAIDVNPLQIGALAALAGNNIGNLGLPVADYLTPRVKAAELANQRLGLLQAANDRDLDRQGRMAELGMQLQAQQQMQAQQQAQVMQAMQARQQFEGQESQKDRAMRALYMQQQAGLQQEELAQRAAYQQGTLAHGDRALDMQQQRMDRAEADRQEMIQAQRMQMALQARSELEQTDRNKRGAFASLVLSGASDIQDPKQLAEFIQKKMQWGVKAGIVSEKEYKDALDMNPSDVMNHVTMDLMLSSYANEAAKNPMIMKALKASISGNTSELTQAQSTKQQEKIINSSQQLKQLDRLQSLIKDNPDVFTTLGSAYAEGNVTADRNKLLSPIIKGSAAVMGYDPQKLDDAKTEIESITSGLWADMAKTMSPRLLTSANKEFRNSLIPATSGAGADSQGNALQKVQVLRNTIENKMKLDQQYLKNGKIEDQDAYDSKLMDILSGANSSSAQPESFSYKGKAVDINKIMKANPNMTKEQVIKYLQENQ
jgi:hypothetical protein